MIAIINPGEALSCHSVNYLKNRKIRTDGMNTGIYPYEYSIEDELFFSGDTLKSFREAEINGHWQYIGFKPFRFLFKKFVIANYLANKGVEIEMRKGGIYARCTGSKPYLMYVGDEIMKEKQ